MTMPFHDRTTAWPRDVDGPPECSSPGEARFDVDELFFSRTDQHGRIRSGNDVFQRVSQYDWEEMVGRPHNLVRHADMPRAVFQILWDRIRAGMNVGAYVKNAARDGSHYWVYAVVTPLEDGFMSVRLKPTSELLHTVESLYQRVRRHEVESRCKPSESVELLLRGLQETGYSDYQSFMTQAFDLEMGSRDRFLSRATSPRIQCFQRLAEAAVPLLKAAIDVMDAAERFRYAPVNLRVQAAGFDQTARAIAVISENYASLAGTISERLGDFRSSAAVMADEMWQGLFLARSADLQDELHDYFLRTSHARADLYIDEADRLKSQADRFRKQAGVKLEQIGHLTRSFFDMTDEMRRYASALTAVRVMGTVESAAAESGELQDLMRDLTTYQSEVASGLETIWKLNNGIRSDIELLNAQRS